MVGIYFYIVDLEKQLQQSQALCTSPAPNSFGDSGINNPASLIADSRMSYLPCHMPPEQWDFQNSCACPTKTLQNQTSLKIYMPGINRMDILVLHFIAEIIPADLEIVLQGDIFNVLILMFYG